MELLQGAGEGEFGKLPEIKPLKGTALLGSVFFYLSVGKDSFDLEQYCMAPINQDDIDLALMTKIYHLLHQLSSIS